VKYTAHIIVFNDTVDDSSFTVSMGRNEFFNSGKQGKTGFIITYSESDFYNPEFIEILNIINGNHKEEQMPLAMYEDGMITESNIKIQCLYSLEKFKELSGNIYFDEIYSLFKHAIKYNRNIYFLF
jgi:hypothetical protein